MSLIERAEAAAEAANVAREEYRAEAYDRQTAYAARSLRRVLELEEVGAVLEITDTDQGAPNFVGNRPVTVTFTVHADPDPIEGFQVECQKFQSGFAVRWAAPSGVVYNLSDLTSFGLAYVREQDAS